MIIGSLPVLTAGYVVSTVLTLGIALFVLIKGRKQPGNIYFVLTCLCLAIFDISFAIATNSSDLAFARKVWTLNIVNIFIPLFYAHWIFSVLNKYEQARFRNYKRVLWVFYGIGLAIFVACLAWPHLYWQEIFSPLYVQSFIHGGPLYIVMLVYFFAVSGYSLLSLIRAHNTSDPDEQNRLRYFIAASIFGYATGITAFPLAFGIPIDPILSMLTSTFVVPLAYGIVREQIMDFKVVLERALVYGTIIGIISALLLGVNILNEWFVTRLPAFGYLTIPLLSAFVAFIIGRQIVYRFREADHVKYEFVTVAAHKLRTPLTRIKWGLTELASRDHSPETTALISQVASANSELIKVSDVLLEAAEEDREQSYAFEKIDLGELVKAAITSESPEYASKKIQVTTQIPFVLPSVYASPEQIREVCHTLLHNALTYTPEGGHVHVELEVQAHEVRVSVSDTGIGIVHAEAGQIFGRFFRSDRAIFTDTEGLGLGLYVARRIIEKHGGHIGFTSSGINKGSSFWFSLKRADAKV